jgi:hypothetical protein
MEQQTHVHVESRLLKPACDTLVPNRVWTSDEVSCFFRPNNPCARSGSPDSNTCIVPGDFRKWLQEKWMPHRAVDEYQDEGRHYAASYLKNRASGAEILQDLPVSGRFSRFEDIVTILDAHGGIYGIQKLLFLCRKANSLHNIFFLEDDSGVVTIFAGWNSPYYQKWTMGIFPEEQEWDPECCSVICPGRIG